MFEELKVKLNGIIDKVISEEKTIELVEFQSLETHQNLVKKCSELENIENMEQSRVVQELDDQITTVDLLKVNSSECGHFLVLLPFYLSNLFKIFNYSKQILLPTSYTISLPSHFFRSYSANPTILHLVFYTSLNLMFR